MVEEAELDDDDDKDTIKNVKYCHNEPYPKKTGQYATNSAFLWSLLLV